MMTTRLAEDRPGPGRAPTLSGLRLRGAAVCLALLFAAAVCAEEPPAPPPPPPPPGPPAQNIRLNFKDASLDTVLDQLSEMTGLTVVKDAPVDGRISIISKQDVNVDGAVALLNTVLKEKGYVGIRTGRVLKLVKLEDAKRRNIPVRTGNDPAQIEATDEVFTQVIPIKYIDAIQLKKDFAPLIPAYAELGANAASNTLILTDTGANIRRIVELVRAMDTQSTVVAEVKVFALKFANATSAARLINDTFKEETPGTGVAGLPPFMRGAALFGFRGGGGGAGGGGGGGAPGAGAAAGGAAAGQTEQGQRLRKVTASADERTNAVVVSANPETMRAIEKVIHDLDANPAEEQAVFIYKCKNAQAANLESVVNTVFGSPGQGLSRSVATQRTSTGSSSNTMRPGTSSSSAGSARTLGGGGSTFGSSGSPFGGGGGGGFRTGAGTATMPAGVQGGDLTGQVYAVADLDSNSLVVLTASKNFDRVRAILAELDKPVPQVLIKVLIAEVTHNKGDDLGADWSVLTKGNVKSTVTDVGISALTDGVVSKFVVGNNLTATLRALATEGKLEILSRPYIMASDNQLSTITVGQKIPIIVNSRITADTGQTINTLQYMDIGIILNVTAHINQEGLVIMDVAPEVSSLTGQTVPISNSAGQPVIAIRSALSRVGVRDGQTVVIGGLMQDNKTENVKGVPGLMRIPGIGALFRRKTTDKVKTELLFFLTPHVALQPEILKEMSAQERAALKLVPKAVEPGTFEEHMEGMDRGPKPISPDDSAPPVKR